jgi:hypothetical protein
MIKYKMSVIEMVIMIMIKILYFLEKQYKASKIVFSWIS